MTAPSPRQHIVASVGEIAPGANKVVTINGRELVVFNINGEFFCLLNRCPHEGAPMSKATCVAVLHSDEPGKFSRSRVGEMLRCPWHGWEFDVRTGQSYFDPVHCKVRVYPTVTEPGDALARGPYVAETFPVSVDETYVLVEA